MKWLARLFLAVAVITLGIDLPAAADAPAALDGNWDGALALNAGLKLRLVLHVETAAGTMGGMLKSVDQGNVVLPISSITLNGTAVSFVLARPVASFQGTLSADGQSIAGTWSQNGGALPLTFMRRAPGVADPTLYRPQEPHPPFPYRAEDVAYDGANGIKLAGTLTMPQSGEAFAAAILIAGSGPQDRDEALFGHKPFLLLADYLTRHGFAVLRSDKRGVGRSTGDFVAATSEDFANDVESAISYLKTRPEIDPKKIGLIGHSEGGLIAPMVAAKDPHVAFIVLMAGPGLRGDIILQQQGRLIAEAMGTPEAEIAKGQALRRQMFDVIEQDPTNGSAKAKALLVAAKPDAPEGAINAQLAMLSSPWFRFFLTYDPVPALKQVHCPVLAINGEKDLQVPPKEDLAAIKQALAGNPDVTTIELPSLNHLFQTAKTGAPSEYSDISETIAPVALDTITVWIEKHTK